MKNPVALLNDYRVEVLSNPVGFSILTYVLRNLSASPEELSEGLHLSSPAITNCITDLYRAGLVSISSNGRYFLRSRCHAMMEELDLIEPALKSQAEDLLPTTYQEYLDNVLGGTGFMHPDLNSPNLLFCQISRIANEGKLRAPERVWYRTLGMLNDCLQKSEGLYLDNHDALAGDFAQDVVNLKANLHRHWAAPEFSEDDSREVMARFILVLVTSRLAGNVNVNRAVCSVTRDFIDVVFADTKVNYLFETNTVHDLWARCTPESLRRTENATDIRSEIEDLLTLARPDKNEHSKNPWVRLLPDNK